MLAKLCPSRRLLRPHRVPRWRSVTGTAARSIRAIVRLLPAGSGNSDDSYTKKVLSLLSFGIPLLVIVLVAAVVLVGFVDVRNMSGEANELIFIIFLWFDPHHFHDLSSDYSRSSE